MAQALLASAGDIDLVRHSFLDRRWKSATQNPITNPITRQLFRLPVRVLTKPGDERIFKVDPEEVSVSITGEAAVLRDLPSKNISVYVDVANIRSARETNQQVKVDVPKEITADVVPRTVNVEQISP